MALIGCEKIKDSILVICCFFMPLKLRIDLNQEKYLCSDPIYTLRTMLQGALPAIFPIIQKLTSPDLPVLHPMQWTGMRRSVFHSAFRCIRRSCKL